MRVNAPNINRYFTTHKGKRTAGKERHADRMALNPSAHGLYFQGAAAHATRKHSFYAYVRNFYSCLAEKEGRPSRAAFQFEQIWFY